MGEVYRATDTKLGRDAALKILPEAFASDPDRMARFTREAQVLASLNHPNIAQIYGVEDHALVMELVDGAEPKGPLPLEMYPLSPSDIKGASIATSRPSLSRFEAHFNLRLHFDGVAALDQRLITKLRPRHSLTELHPGFELSNFPFWVDDHSAANHERL